MIVSELKLYNFRRFKSVDGAPGLHITFHKGLNALIGENDSGFNSLNINPALSCMPVKLNNHAVIVVPTFAPIITLTV